MTPSHYAPEPWPVDGPAELSDNEYAAARANVDSPYISNILAALNNAGGSRVVVWLLMLGRNIGSPPPEDRPDEIFQGYYIRAVVRDREALRLQLEPLGGITGASRGEAGQLALSVRMIPLAPEETRQKIVGWGFSSL